jgi:hypothetical protein
MSQWSLNEMGTPKKLVFFRRVCLPMERQRPARHTQYGICRLGINLHHDFLWKTPRALRDHLCCAAEIHDICAMRIKQGMGLNPVRLPKKLPLIYRPQECGVDKPLILVDCERYRHSNRLSLRHPPECLAAEHRPALCIIWLHCLCQYSVG